jgi:cytoskeletal protein CcmA (bactofilin family)
MDKSLVDDSLSQQAETVVGPSVKIQGDLNSEGNIRIEGQVSGKVKTSQSVFVNQGAKITADLLAGNAVIGGEVQGNLKISGHLILQSTAKLSGDIACQILRVEDGAQFTGKCAMNGAESQTGATVVTNGNHKKSGRAGELEPEE